MTKTCDTGTNWKQSNEVVTAQISRGEDVANNNTKNRMLSDSLVMKKVQYLGLNVCIVTIMY